MLTDGAVRIIVDSRLSDGATALSAVFPHRHVLVQPWMPEGFHPVPGMDQSLPLERRSIFLSRNDKHPIIWGWVVAAWPDDLERDPSLYPGCMIIFQRFANERIGIDKPSDPLWPSQKHYCDIVHIDAISCTFNPPLIAPPRY